MFKAGMDMYDQDLTQAQEKEWIKLNEHLYGYTDEEIGRLAKELTQNVELTGTGIGDTVNPKVSAGDIDDAIKNPLKTLPVKYDSSERPSYKVIGKTATVSINPDTGRLITVYPTHKNLAEKLIKEGEK